MPNIKKLDKAMINQIAAGEVVIQPCSVLKELVENSIDAGASKVEIHFYGSGADRLEVHDNGMGMSKEDISLCIEPHATSKIDSIEDLYGVMSCGFRGEALASIAEVSEFEIISKTKDSDHANSLSNKTGKVAHNTASRGTGTSVIIKNLFHNVPVRRRFLKSDRAETGNNLDILKKLALSRPWIGITVKHDDKMCFECPEEQSLIERIQHLGLFDSKNKLLEVNFEREGVKVTGACVAPPQHFGNATKIQLYINRRPIKDKALTQAFVRAYASYIPERRFPGAIIFMDINPNDVDVNIHPTKSEVRFHQPEVIFKCLYGAIKNVLSDSAQIEDACESTPLVYKKTGMIRTVPMNRSYGGVHEKSDNQPFKQDSFLESEKNYSPPSFSESKPVDENIGIKTSESQFEPTNSKSFNQPSQEFIPEIPVVQEKSFSVDRLPKAFQLLNRFLVVEFDDYFEIMDQHAVHERVLFNQLYHEEKNKDLVTQMLLAPLEISFPGGLHEVSQNIMEDFESMGFSLDWNDAKDGLLVLGIPDFLDAAKAVQILEEILNELVDGVLPQKENLRKNILHSTACRAAIKAGDALTEEEIKNILAATLSMDDTQGCCPHGRNSRWRVSIEEANLMFNR